MPGRRHGKLGARLNVRGRTPGLVGIISWAVGKTAAPLRRATDAGDSGRRRFFELEFLDPVANLIAVQAQQRGRARLIPAAALERLHHQRALRAARAPRRVAGSSHASVSADTRAAPAGNARSVSWSPSASSMARSIAFRSSRMLPGQP